MARHRATVHHRQDCRDDSPTAAASSSPATTSASTSLDLASAAVTATADTASPASRVTRSAARLAAESPQSASSAPSSVTPAAGSAQSCPRKRKAPPRSDRSLEEAQTPANPPSPRRRSSKRQRVAASPSTATAPAPAALNRGSRNRSAMSQPGPSSRPTEEPSKNPAFPPSNRRKSSKHAKVSQERPSTTQPPPSRRQKKRSGRTDQDVIMKDAEEEMESPDGEENEDDDMDEHDSSPPSESNDGTNPSAFDDDEEDPFHSSLFSSRSPLGLQSTLRALSGMMSGMSSRLRDILSNLRTKEDPSVQLIALQELSDLLLVSNEDNLAGAFSPDPYVKELVALMQPSDFGEENPEIMLLACRCLANLMEALQGSVANVVYGGAVPVLCQKLLDIQFIDLAEQALSTLSKISVDFPASIVREGGLTACLTYLDFFPTSTQRTAVTTAANCCRNLPSDSFPVVRDVMPTLLNVLSSNDPKVVEQGCLCVSRIVESFKNKPEKLEELIEPAMLKAVLRLLLPGTTNLIGPHIHTQFLRVLSITCKTSPRLSAELLKMDVVDTLYQILTGISPPHLDSTSVKMDGVLVMQALIHRPREQVFETLNVICEILPSVPARFPSHADTMLSTFFENSMTIGSQSPKTKETAEKRRSMLMDCQDQLKRFAMILLPTLTDAFSSTVNLGVRQKVLGAQLKMLYNLESSVIEDALCTVPYASFLGTILSQKDHPSLVSLALRCAELLLQRLEHVYQIQFHREGVISEVVKLAEEPLSTEKANKQPRGSTSNGAPAEEAPSQRSASPEDNPGSDSENQEGADDFDDEDDQDDYPDDDMSGSESLAFDTKLTTKMDNILKDLVTNDARAFLDVYEASETRGMRDKAMEILHQLQALAKEIKQCYDANQDGLPLFRKLASYFGGDALESITSSEILNSGVIEVLLDVFGGFQAPSMRDARGAFLQAFMGSTLSEKAQSQSTATTPFSVLINKLQDLLSRTEHFEVVTVGQNSLENTRSNATHMLGKQLRLKLVADDDSDIPRSYRNIMVSIHAIATFKSLDDFLHPRISLSDRPRISSTQDTVLSQIANAARLREQLAGNNGELNSSGDAEESNRSGTEVANPPRANESSRSTKTSPTDDHQRTKHRRSDRRRESNDEDEHGNEPLECADAKQLSGDDDGGADEDDGDDGNALNAIVDDLDEDSAGNDDTPENNTHDPTAVNMEVASTGKVTARKEDGTRVSTPSQTPASKSSSSSAHRPATQPAGNSLLSSAGRPRSYAAAMASVPQDWHIEFSIDGKPISNDTTVYRAVHHGRENMDVQSARNVWSAIHTIKFRRVPGPPPPEPSTAAPGLPESSVPGGHDGMPSSLSKDTTTSSILQLLGVLHEMNATLDDILAEIKELVAVKPEPLAQFINTKLTAKLNRQLEEPLIVASSCLPSWSEDLARLFPFLFPFETRHLFLQSTAFGYSRAMLRWHNSQNDQDRDRHDERPFLGRLPRQKVRISRSRILDSAMKVMELYGSSPSILEVEYFEEVGTGLGPTLEFYSTVSKEFSRKKLKLWRENDNNNGDEYAYGRAGLFPAPMSDAQASQESGKKQLHLFRILGKFIARSMLDSRIIDVSFNPAFFRIADVSSSVAPSLGTVKVVDHDLANSLLLLKRFANAKKAIESDASLSSTERTGQLQDVEIDGARVEDLGLDFTLPGYPNIELVDNGSDVSVTIENVDVYVDRVVDMTLGSGVRRQVEAFRTGFSQVFPYSSLRTFTPSELVILFGKAEEDWSIETLMDSIKADHGFNMDSPSVRNLLQTMSEFDLQQRRGFLQFVTGSPKLPIGGFKSLTPIFTVVCRPSEPPYMPDDYLPSVMTCVNYLKLPDYSTVDVLRKRLTVAMKEGQGAFHLS